MNSNMSIELTIIQVYKHKSSVIQNLAGGTGIMFHQAPRICKDVYPGLGAYLIENVFHTWLHVRRTIAI